MSIFARRVREPSANSPARIRRKRSRLSSTGRSRKGLFFPGSVSVPRVRADLVGREVADEGLPAPDQLLGEVVEPPEVVRGVEHPVPLEAEPADVLLDRVDVLDVLLEGVRVVEAEVAGAAVLLRDAEVQADRLGVADVEVAVRLGREARRDALPPPGAEVLLDDLADEVLAGGLGGGGRRLFHRGLSSGRPRSRSSPPARGRAAGSSRARGPRSSRRGEGRRGCR